MQCSQACYMRDSICMHSHTLLVALHAYKRAWCCRVNTEIMVHAAHHCIYINRHHGQKRHGQSLLFSIHTMPGGGQHHMCTPLLPPPPPKPPIDPRYADLITQACIQANKPCVKVVQLLYGCLTKFTCSCFSYGQPTTSAHHHACMPR